MYFVEYKFCYHYVYVDWNPPAEVPQEELNETTPEDLELSVCSDQDIE